MVVTYSRYSQLAFMIWAAYLKSLITFYIHLGTEYWFHSQIIAMENN